MADPAGETKAEALLDRARGGDAEALRTLFELHTPLLEARIRRFLPAAVQQRVSVADVLQETRILAFERTVAFDSRGDDAYRAWLLKIAELKAREALRTHKATSKRAVGREVRASVAVGSGGVPAGDPSPSEAAMGAERRAAVLRALEALPPDSREVLRLARLEGRPIHEVAVSMGRSTDAVKKLYGRALARFAKLYAAGDGPSP